MSPQRLTPDRLAEARPLSDFLDAVATSVHPLGFVADRTLAAVSICRDELTQHVTADVERRWGPVFALGGLGGLPSLGRTGWGACLSHVPNSGGRGRFLVIGLTHVGVGPEGEVGMSLRRDQDEPTPTCGALASILSTWGSAVEPSSSELGDHEAQLLARLVADQVAGSPADIVELTFAAAAAVQHEMTIQLEALAPWDDMDVAMFTGVLVHMATGEDRVVPISAQYRAHSGIPRDLELARQVRGPGAP